MGGEVFRVDDRQKAINMAVKMAKPGDIVVVTGKGHEKSMCFGKSEYRWSDREALVMAIDKVLFVPVGNVLEMRREEGIEALRGVFAKYAEGKPKLTPTRLEKLRVKMYTERYKRFLRQNESNNNSK